MTVSPRSPTLVEVMSQILDDRAELISVCIPGEVEDFNRTTRTARVRPVVLKSDGSSYPVLPYVPVVFPGLYWDVQDGEQGLLIMADTDWRTWWRTGEDATPETISVHQLSNAFFIPGIQAEPDVDTVPSDAKVIERIPGASGELRLGDSTADKQVVHEDLLSDLNSFFTQLELWAAAVDIVCGTNFAATKAVTDAMQVKIGTGDYEADNVMVKN